MLAIWSQGQPEECNCSQLMLCLLAAAAVTTNGLANGHGLWSDG